MTWTEHTSIYVDSISSGARCWLVEWGGAGLSPRVDGGLGFALIKPVGTRMHVD